MSIAPPTPLQSFHQFVERKLSTNEAVELSPDQALALWKEEQATLNAIREGLADIESGRSQSLEEFDRDFRRQHNMPSHRG